MYFFHQVEAWVKGASKKKAGSALRWRCGLSRAPDVGTIPIATYIHIYMYYIHIYCQHVCPYTHVNTRVCVCV